MWWIPDGGSLSLFRWRNDGTVSTSHASALGCGSTRARSSSLGATQSAQQRSMRRSSTTTGDRLLYIAITRNGFTSALREELFKRFRGLETPECPFANLPESKSGRWGQGLTAAKMADCRWLRPVLVGQFEFLEWTPENHLRHSRFMGLREDKTAQSVVRESTGLLIAACLTRQDHARSANHPAQPSRLTKRTVTEFV